MNRARMEALQPDEAARLKPASLAQRLALQCMGHGTGHAPVDGFEIAIRQAVAEHSEHSEHSEHWWRCKLGSGEVNTSCGAASAPLVAEDCAGACAK